MWQVSNRSSFNLLGACLIFVFFWAGGGLRNLILKLEFELGTLGHLAIGILNSLGCRGSCPDVQINYYRVHRHLVSSFFNFLSLDYFQILVATFAKLNVYS